MKNETNYNENVKSILFIDYENIQKFNLSEYDMSETKIYFFIGNNQRKIPIDIIIQTQKLGNAIEWIKIEGQGKNVLDFYISFFLGQLHHYYEKDVQFTILSRDAGFDSLISFINNTGRKCHRITDILHLNNDVHEDTKKD